MLLMYKFRTQHWPQGMMSIHEEQQSNFTTCQTVHFKHWQRFPSITVSSFSSVFSGEVIFLATCGPKVIKNWLKLIAMPPILYSSWLLLMNHSVVLFSIAQVTLFWSFLYSFDHIDLHCIWPAKIYQFIKKKFLKGGGRQINNFNQLWEFKGTLFLPSSLGQPLKVFVEKLYKVW